MKFAEILKKEAAFTRTENGAVALSTTGDACLDLFGCMERNSRLRHSSL